MQKNNKKIESLIAQILVLLGEDIKRKGIIKTPKRVAEVLISITSGKHILSKQVINGAIFVQETKNMVVIKNIEFYSTCEHHMLPFFGTCHIGYIPKGKILGVSKIARIVDMFARRLQIQEQLTDQVSAMIQDTLNPIGVGVIMEAQHFCMMMRGVKKQQTSMITSSMKGVFKTRPEVKDEFLSLIKYS